jgi:hypothetical protein
MSPRGALRVWQYAVIQLYVADECEGISGISFGFHLPIEPPLWITRCCHFY